MSNLEGNGSRSGKSHNPLPAVPMVSVSELGFRYAGQEKWAIRNLTFSVGAGELFAVVGPNGGGKSTTFRILSTLLPMQTGSATLMGYDFAHDAMKIRKAIGVVFQAAALDKTLTVKENWQHTGWLYGLRSKQLEQRMAELAEKFHLTERLSDRVGSLSGGLMRRVEIAKAMLHHPKVLLLDEPTVGLDPLARRELWMFLKDLVKTKQVTLLWTTHFLEEAEFADRVLLIHQGQGVALGSPAQLESAVGESVLFLESEDLSHLQGKISQEWGVQSSIVDHKLRVQDKRGIEMLTAILHKHSRDIKTLQFGRPTLEDVFMEKTGEAYSRELPS